MSQYFTTIILAVAVGGILVVQAFNLSDDGTQDISAHNRLKQWHKLERERICKTNPQMCENLGTPASGPVASGLDAA